MSVRVGDEEVQLTKAIDCEPRQRFELNGISHVDNGRDGFSSGFLRSGNHVLEIRVWERSRDKPSSSSSKFDGGRGANAARCPGDNTNAGRHARPSF